MTHQSVFPFEELTLNRHLRQQHGIDWEIGNYAFGASPGNPFLHLVIENCVKAQQDADWIKPMMRGIPGTFRSDFNVLNSTGPGLLTRTYAENPTAAANVTVLFPEDVCDEKSWHNFGSYARAYDGRFLREQKGVSYIESSPCGGNRAPEKSSCQKVSDLGRNDRPGLRLRTETSALTWKRSCYRFQSNPPCRLAHKLPSSFDFLSGILPASGGSIWPQEG